MTRRPSAACLSKEDMNKTDLLPGVQDFLCRCPKSGEGVHRWIFSAALTLHRARVPESEMAGLIFNATKNCGRDVSSQEIKDAIVNSGRYLRDGISAERRTPKWPTPNLEQIEAITRDGIGLDGLREISPAKWSDSKPHTEEVIDLLFPGNPLLCVGQSKYTFSTKPREDWRGSLIRRELIVPSTMSKNIGITKDGKKSTHTLDNTGPRRFLVIEFDKGTFDQHARQSWCIFPNLRGSQNSRRSLWPSIVAPSRSTGGFTLTGNPKRMLKGSSDTPLAWALTRQHGLAPNLYACQMDGAMTKGDDNKLFILIRKI